MREMTGKDMNYPADAVAGERVWHGELRWAVSWRDAGTPVEEDGVGVAPSRVRALLLAQYGEWRVWVDAMTARPKVLRTLRAKFNQSLSEARRAAVTPGYVYTGTRGEATLLAEGLAAEGVDATIVGPEGMGHSSGSG